MRIHCVFWFIFLITTLAGLTLGERAYSQEGVDIIEEAPEATQDKYVEPSFENLSKMYWAIGKFDIAEDEVIDHYLMINECEVYQQYYHNDFEWEKIQNATREYIQNHLNEFPTHFELLSAISLGRYDQEKEEFEILEGDKIRGKRRLDLEMNMLGYKEICNRPGIIYEYPENIIVILSRPLIIETVPVKKELARLYIEEARSFYDGMPANIRSQNYERLAFLRLKIRITQYKDTVKITGGALRAVVFGRVEGYEIYADQQKLKPLYIKNFEGGRFRRLRKDTPQQVEDQDPAINEELEKIRSETESVDMGKRTRKGGMVR